VAKPLEAIGMRKKTGFSLHKEIIPKMQFSGTPTFGKIIMEDYKGGQSVLSKNSREA